MNKGFTLIELMLVIAILAVLIATVFFNVTTNINNGKEKVENQHMLEDN